MPRGIRQQAEPVNFDYSDVEVDDDNAIDDELDDLLGTPPPAEPAPSKPKSLKLKLTRPNGSGVEPVASTDTGTGSEEKRRRGPGKKESVLKRKNSLSAAGISAAYYDDNEDQDISPQFDEAEKSSKKKPRSYKPRGFELESEDMHDGPTESTSAEASTKKSKLMDPSRSTKLGRKKAKYLPPALSSSETEEPSSRAPVHADFTPSPPLGEPSYSRSQQPIMISESDMSNRYLVPPTATGTGKYKSTGRKRRQSSVASDTQASKVQTKKVKLKKALKAENEAEDLAQLRERAKDHDLSLENSPESSTNVLPEWPASGGHDEHSAPGDGIIPEAIVKTKKRVSDSGGAPKKSAYKRKPGEPGPGKNWRKGLKKGMTRPGFHMLPGGESATDAGSPLAPALAGSSPLRPDEGKRPSMAKHRLSEANVFSSDLEGSIKEDGRKTKKGRISTHASRLGEGSDEESMDARQSEVDPNETSMAGKGVLPPPPNAARLPQAPNRKSLFIPIGVKVDLSAPADPAVLGHLVYQNHIPGKAIPIFKIPQVPSKAEERERMRENEEIEARNYKKGASVKPAAKPLETGPPPRKWILGRRAILGVAGARLELKSWIGSSESPWHNYLVEKQQEAVANLQAGQVSLGELPTMETQGTSTAAPSPAILELSAYTAEVGRPQIQSPVSLAAAAAASAAAKPRDPRGRKPGVKNKPKRHTFKDAYRGGSMTSGIVGSPLQKEVSAFEGQTEVSSAIGGSPAASIRGDSPVSISTATGKKKVTKANNLAQSEIISQSEAASAKGYDSESVADSNANAMDVDEGENEVKVDVDAEMEDLL